MRHKYYHKRIAPRLLSGDSREQYAGGLPPEIKEGLFKIAEKEGKSVSWVLEQVIIDYFGLKKPKYKLPKVTVEEQEKHIDKMTEMGLGKSLIKPYIITAKGYDEIAMLKKRGMKRAAK